MKRASSLLRSVGGALLAMLLMAPTVSASAMTLGGLHATAFAGAQASTRAMTDVELDWNVDVEHARAPYVNTLTVTAGAGAQFHDGDRIEATVELRDGAECLTEDDVADDTSRVDLAFDECDALLTDVTNVAFVVTSESGTRSSGSVALRGTIDAFSGPLVDSDISASTDYVATEIGGSQVLEHLSLSLPELGVDEILGQRIVVVLKNPDTDAPTSAVTVVGSAGGAWAQAHESGVRVNVDLGELAAHTGLVTSPVEAYELILLRTQHWQAGTSEPGVVARAGVIEEGDPGDGGDAGDGEEPDDDGSGGDGDPDPTDPDPGEVPHDGIVPVNLDERLSYSEPNGPFTLNDATKLQFCYTFAVTNVSLEQVEWAVTLDTTLAPFWGLNPTIVQAGGIGTLNQIWNGQTSVYDSASGLWSVAGVDWNRSLAPGATAVVGFCATAAVPLANPATFDTPLVSVDPSSNPYSVALRVNVTSPSRYFVPWEVEIDLSDYVCAASLPQQFSTENASLTHIEGTRYLLRGTEVAGTRFVSESSPRDFVFARYSPGGKPFEAGACE